MSGNLSKSAFFEGGWVTLNADFRGKGASPTNHSWYQSSRVIALSCGIKNICSASFSFVTIHTCDRRTDRRTDRQNYDSQDRPRICSRGKNYKLGLYGGKHFKCNHMMTLDSKGLKTGYKSVEFFAEPMHELFQSSSVFPAGLTFTNQRRVRREYHTLLHAPVDL